MINSKLFCACINIIKSIPVLGELLCHAIRSARLNIVRIFTHGRYYCSNGLQDQQSCGINLLYCWLLFMGHFNYQYCFKPEPLRCYKNEFMCINSCNKNTFAAKQLQSVHKMSFYNQLSTINACLIFFKNTYFMLSLCSLFSLKRNAGLYYNKVWTGVCRVT